MLCFLALFLDIMAGPDEGNRKLLEALCKVCELFVIKASETLNVQLLFFGLVIAALDSP